MRAVRHHPLPQEGPYTVVRVPQDGRCPLYCIWLQIAASKAIPDSQPCDQSGHTRKRGVYVYIDMYIYIYIYIDLYTP